MFGISRRLLVQEITQSSLSQINISCLPVAPFGQMSYFLITTTQLTGLSKFSRKMTGYFTIPGPYHPSLLWQFISNCVQVIQPNFFHLFQNLAVFLWSISALYFFMSKLRVTHSVKTQKTI